MTISVGPGRQAAVALAITPELASRALEASDGRAVIVVATPRR